MNRCRTCKFWGVDYDDVCDYPRTIMSDATPKTQFVIFAEADDESGLMAYLYTGPEFGCIHHSKKEDEPDGN
jgi:hypothetical protein